MLDVISVTKQFGNKEKSVMAVHETSFSIQKEEIFALIGESGSGKSTLAEIIVGLQEPTQGSIAWHRANDVEDRSNQKKVQIVFQNPDRSLNPYWKVEDILIEPLVLSNVPRLRALEQAVELLDRLKLPCSLLDRRPCECSGGQKQRIAIARALSMSPALLIADEVTSALDPSTEKEILTLLQTLKQEQKMSILYITHHLETIAGFSDRMAVMKNGRIVEMGETKQVLRSPNSTYTKALLDACW
ncbi:ABC transporter ATP-binding protein [Brevibacillus daliensis]|uniref:ABC transporter ATP-binding protein n=1 Tax=Brevibacillus daliensis TaxID=2892995 RepID=UPI001E49F5CD|nr:ABC transporter ATP-binding protein [Brevibacillus daliensis]